MTYTGKYTEQEYRKMLAVDPGRAEFADYAKMLIEAGRSKEALIVCLSGLSISEEGSVGRLMLARVYYELGYYPFAIKELAEISHKFPENKQLRDLLDKLQGKSKVATANATLKDAQKDESLVRADSETVAQAELSWEQIEVLESEKE